MSNCVALTNNATIRVSNEVYCSQKTCSMYKLNDVLKTPPLIGRLIFGNESDVNNLVGDRTDVLIVALEKDYLFLGIRIKNVLESGGKVVSALSLDACDLSAGAGELFSGYDCVIAVGERQTLELSRRYAKGLLVFVPTTLNYYYAFSPRVSDTSRGLLSYEEARLPDKVFFDLDMVARFKLRHVADGFSMVAVSAFWKFEYKANCLISGEADEVTPVIDGALATLKGVSDKPYDTIIKCQAFLALAVGIAPSLDFLSDRFMAHALSRINDFPTEESRLFSADYIIKYYAHILKKDVSVNLIMPDYNKSLAAVADVLRVEPVAVLENYEPLDEKTCHDGIKKLFDAHAATDAGQCDRLLKSYKRVYDGLYKGRHKRMEMDKRTAADVFALSAYTAEGVIRLFADSGLIDLIRGGN